MNTSMNIPTNPPGDPRNTGDSDERRGPACVQRLEQLMSLCRQCVASDLHLSPGMPPYVRRHGQLLPVEKAEPVASIDVQTMARALMNDRQWEVFQAQHAIDIAYSSPGGGRFRINVFRQRQGVSIALRRLEDRLLDLQDWNLPEDLAALGELSDGLVIVTGPTGSGKTTTLATLLNGISQRRACHVITVEDPVEYLHQSGRSLIHQRELYTDVDSFANAIRSAMREDPDVLLIGEIRDLDTLRAAITAAETGHLVFSTLHTGDAVGSLDRMVGLFPANEQDSVRQQLSMALRAVVAQKLLPRCDEEGRLPAVELLHVTSAVANLIRTGRTEQIYSLIESGRGFGMRTMEQDLARLVRGGQVSLEEARRSVRKLEMFHEWLRSGARAGAAERRG